MNFRSAMAFEEPELYQSAFISETEKYFSFRIHFSNASRPFLISFQKNVPAKLSLPAAVIQKLFHFKVA